MGPARRIVPTVFTALALLVACGLPEDDDPRLVAPENVPQDLVVPGPTVSTLDATGTFEVAMYFIQGDRLRAVDQNLPSVEPRNVLIALVGAPAPDGFTTAIPQGTQIERVELTGSDRTLVVDLSSGILLVGATEQKNAFAQLVCTASALRNVGGVRFRVDGENVDVVTDEGSESGPLRCGDFSSLLSA